MFGEIALIALVCLDPPVKGRPADFSGIVGNVTATATAAPNHFRLDASAVFSIEITGKAKYDQAVPPPIQNQDVFRKDFAVVGPVQTKPRQEGIVFEFPIQANNTDVQQIPSLRIWIYDDGAFPGYRIVRTNPVKITIEAGRSARETTVEPERVSPQPSIHFEIIIGFVIGISLLLLLAVYISQRSQLRKDGSIQTTELGITDRREQTPRSPMDELADKLSLPPGRRTSQDIISRMSSMVNDRELIDEARSLFAEVDRSRYSPAGTDHGDKIAVAVARIMQKLSASAEAERPRYGKDEP